MSDNDIARSSQVSSSYALTVGRFRVTVLLDSVLDFPLSLVTGATHSDLCGLHASSLRGPRSISTVNTYLIQGDNENILVDTGVGGGDTAETTRLVHELAQAGVTPEDITHVLFTHLHSDHAGGAVTADGQPAFPNAQLVAHRDEEPYWFADAAPEGTPEVVDQYVAAQALRSIRSQFRWIEAGSVLPGVELVHLPGHTPGHSGFRVGTDNSSVVVEPEHGSLLLWGDIVHQPQIQFPRPDLGVVFDVDPAQAALTRTEIMRECAQRGDLIAGNHIDFPATGYVREVAPNSFQFVPIVWQPAVHAQEKPLVVSP